MPFHISLCLIFKNNYFGGTWLALLEEHATLDLGVVILSPVPKLNSKHVNAPCYVPITKRDV